MQLSDMHGAGGVKSILIHFLPLIFFVSPVSGDMERDQWYEMR